MEHVRGPNDDFAEWQRRAGLGAPPAPVESSDVASMVRLVDEGPLASPIPEYFRWEPRDHWMMVEARKDALFRLKQHAVSDDRNEVFGLLLGRVSHRPGLCVTIEEVVPARQAQGTQTSFALTGDAWTPVFLDLDRIQAQRRDLRIVGWYHTHPRMQVFLSSDDVRTHEQICPSTWQIALVFDPVSDQTGIFTRARNGSLIMQIPRQETFRMADATKPGDLPSISLPAASGASGVMVRRSDHAADRMEHSGDARAAAIIRVTAEDLSLPTPRRPPVAPEAPRYSEWRLFWAAGLLGLPTFTVVLLVRMNHTNVPRHELAWFKWYAQGVLLGSFYAVLATLLYYYWPRWLFAWRMFWYSRVARTNSQAAATVTTSEGGLPVVAGRNRLRNVCDWVRASRRRIIVFWVAVMLSILAGAWWMTEGLSVPLPGLVTSDGPMESQDTQSQSQGPGTAFNTSDLTGNMIDAWYDPDSGKVTVLWGQDATRAKEVIVYRWPEREASKPKSVGRVNASVRVFSEEAPRELVKGARHYSYSIATVDSGRKISSQGPPSACRRLPTFTDMQANQRSIMVEVEWHLAVPVSNGTYGILRTVEDSSKEIARDLSPKQRSFTDQAPLLGKSVDYRVIWTDKRGNRKESRPAHILAWQLQPPNRVQVLTSPDTRGFRIYWSSPDTDGVQGYRVYRKVRGQRTWSGPKRIRALGPDEWDITDKDAPTLDRNRIQYIVGAYYGPHRGREVEQRSPAYSPE